MLLIFDSEMGGYQGPGDGHARNSYIAYWKMKLEFVLFLFLFYDFERNIATAKLANNTKKSFMLLSFKLGSLWNYSGFPSPRNFGIMGRRRFMPLK